MAPSCLRPNVFTSNSCKYGSYVIMLTRRSDTLNHFIVSKTALYGYRCLNQNQGGCAEAWACWLDSWPPQSLSKMLNPKLPRMVRQQRVIVWMVTDPNDQGSHYKQCLRLFFVMIVLFLHFRKLRSDFGDYGKIWQDLALNSHF